MLAEKEIRATIVQLVENMQGCKLTELVVQSIIQESFPEEILEDMDVFVDRIEKMAEEGELILISYTLPDLQDRKKYFLLPPHIENFSVTVP